MTDCPCCGYQMVRCFRKHQMVAFCRHCWQEMPQMPIQNTYSLLKWRSLEQMVQQPVPQKQPALQKQLGQPQPVAQKQSVMQNLALAS